MADYPYSPMPSMIKEFFAKIQSVGKPEKVTLKYLISIGFKSNNDRPIIPILKALGFVDTSGVPTELWQRYRNKADARGIIAQAIRAAYADLFATYSDANRKDDEALRNFFSSKTSVADKTVGYMVKTFSSLCELGDFEAAPPAIDPALLGPASATPGAAATTIAAASTTKGTTINVNIQLTLPETTDAAVYDTIFASLKKHLLV